MVIEIAGQRWEVQKVDAHDPGLFVDGEVCRGATWCGYAKIYLSNELTGDQIARVIRHELAHAYIFSTQAVRPEHWDEEDVCELLGIYAKVLCDQCEQICEELYPEAVLPCSESLWPKVPAYVHIKWADQLPTEESHNIKNEPARWMGIYTGSSLVSPDNWDAYKWYDIYAANFSI